MKFFFRFSTLFGLIILSSCSLLNKQGPWGKNALYPIRAERILMAVKKNASSAHVWVPALGAGIFGLFNFDHNLSNWISNEASIFKNSEAADNWSDHFNNILLLEMYSVVLLTPSQDENKSFGGFVLNKVRGGLTVSFAAASSKYTTKQVKKAIHRERPNKLDYKSMPSGHASVAGSRRVLVTNGLEAIEMDSHLRLGINSLNATMAIGTMWARVEGKRHYPSDVLVGYALGSFVSGVVYDSLINYDPGQAFSFIPMGDKVFASYTFQF